MLNMIEFSTNFGLRDFPKSQKWLNLGFASILKFCLFCVYHYTICTVSLATGYHCTKGTMNLSKHSSLTIKSSVMGNVN